MHQPREGRQRSGTLAECLRRGGEGQRYDSFPQVSACAPTWEKLSPLVVFMSLFTRLAESYGWFAVRLGANASCRKRCYYLRAGFCYLLAAPFCAEGVKKARLPGAQNRAGGGQGVGGKLELRSGACTTWNRCGRVIATGSASIFVRVACRWYAATWWRRESP